MTSDVISMAIEGSNPRGINQVFQCVSHFLLEISPLFILLLVDIVMGPAITVAACRDGTTINRKKCFLVYDS